MPDVSASGRLNVFSLCSLSQYIYFLHVHKFFRVSGLGISARARGNFMHNNILRHTSVQFAIRWAGMWNLSRRGTCNRRAAWQKTLYIRWLLLCIIFLLPLSLSAGLLGRQPVRCGPDTAWPLILFTYYWYLFSRIWFLSGKTGLFCLILLLVANLYTGCLSCQIGMMIYSVFCSSFPVLFCLRWVQ